MSTENNNVGILQTFLAIRKELKKHLLRILLNQNEIDDILQEAYIRAHLAEGKREILNPRAFLYKVARNLAFTELKKSSDNLSRHVPDVDFNEEVDVKTALEKNLIDLESLEEFHENVLKALPPQCARIYVMRKVYRLSYKEIAEELNISVSTVEKHLIKGVRRYDEYVSSKSSNENESRSKVLSAGQRGENSSE